MTETVVRHGLVSEVDAVGHRVRVTFEDNDNVVSAWLPVLVQVVGKNNIYCLPKVGETAVCIFESNDSEQGDGFFVGSFYNDKNKPKISNANKMRLDFNGGSFIEFDESTGNLLFNIKGEFTVKADKINLN